MEDTAVVMRTEKDLHREIIRICENCKRPDCPGGCPERTEAERDIDEMKERGALGDSCDVETWMRLRAWLDNEEACE